MIGIIAQARSGSNRLPRKIYKDINGKYTLQRVMENVKEARLPHKIIFALPEYDKQEFNDRLAKGEFKDYTDDRFGTYFGNPDNLIDRYFMAARQYGLDTIVRVTCDCPMVSGKIIDEMIIQYEKTKFNGFMGSNETVSAVPYPDGTDVEIFKYWMLAEAHQLATDPVHLEHCCPYFYRRGTQYEVVGFENKRPNTQITMKFRNFSLDTMDDFMLIEKIAKEYDKHKDLNKALKDTSYPTREWRSI